MRDAEPAVHVWIVGLDVADDVLSAANAVLSDDERARARRLRVAADARRYTASHAALRHVLAGYAGVPPAALRISADAMGKPRLDGGPHFNLSHSGSMALVAVGGARRVGVDVEQQRAGIGDDGMRRRYFRPAENAAIDSLPPALRETAFLLCWTRKEAYLKATGAGLAALESGFEVGCLPGRPPWLARLPASGAGAGRWSIHDVALPPGYVGAVVVEGADIALVTRSLSLGALWTQA